MSGWCAARPASRVGAGTRDDAASQPPAQDERERGGELREEALRRLEAEVRQARGGRTARAWPRPALRGAASQRGLAGRPQLLPLLAVLIAPAAVGWGSEVWSASATVRGTAALSSNGRISPKSRTPLTASLPARQSLITPMTTRSPRHDLCHHLMAILMPCVKRGGECERRLPWMTTCSKKRSD